LKKALITGITGQDGSYLAELLLSKGYHVHGIVLRSEIEDPERAMARLSAIERELELHVGSIESYPSLHSIIEKVAPDECYHLAASSFVSYSFDEEFSVFNTNIGGTHNVLSALKNAAPNCRFYFAGSSELFGRARTSPQNEDTPFNPRSVYGITKVTGYFLTSNYRENYGMYACTGIAFNHEYQGADTNTSRARSPTALRRSNSVCLISWLWATWKRCEIGGTLLITSRPCGKCCSSQSRATTSLPPGWVILSGNSASWHLPG